MQQLPDKHEIRVPGTSDATQGTLRLYPEAFLAPSILVCEGASEVGLIRGIDQYRVEQGQQSLRALGVCPIDCGGGPPERLFQRASAFQALGYRTAILRDNDKQADPNVDKVYRAAHGSVFEWRKGFCLEDELFQSLPKESIQKLLELAINLQGETVLNEHIKSASKGTVDLKAVQKELASANISAPTRELLGRASSPKSGWFKNVRPMEMVGRHIVGPSLTKSHKDFATVVNNVFTWIAN